MQACLRGDLDLAPAGLRYLAALAVSRLAMGGLARLVSAYRAAQHHDSAGAEAAPRDSTPASPTAPRPSPEQAAPQRRRSDRPAGDDSDSTTLAA
jgi:hypothetical protein